MARLDRGDLIAGLSDLARELAQAGAPTGLRIVGGAALALRYFDRESTRDVDVLHAQPGTDDDVLDAAAVVAEGRGWDADWLNFAVTGADALPILGRSPQWHRIHDRHGIVIEVASAETLLVMKLRANRPGRDTDDIRQLMALCGIASLDAAIEVYEDYYPGDSLSDRAVSMVVAILAGGPLEMPGAVPSPEL